MRFVLLDANILIGALDGEPGNVAHDDALRTANYPEDQQNKHKTNRQNELTSLEEDCGCLSTYTTLIENTNYKEIVRIK